MVDTGVRSKVTRRPPAPRAARAAVATAFVGLGLGAGSWATRIPAVKHSLGLSAAELGVALFGIAFGSLLSMPLAGVLVARRGSRPVLRGTALAFAASLVLPALAWNLPTLWLALTVFGATQGALDVAMNTHGVTVEHAIGRPILSSLHGGFSAGTLLGAGLGAIAAGLGIDVRIHLAAIALLIAVSTLVAGHYLLAAEEDRGAASQQFVLRLPRQLLALGAIAFLCLLAEGAATDWSAVYLAGPLHASADVAALAFGAFAGAMTLGRLAGDRISRALGEITVVRAGALLGAVGLTIGLVVGDPVLAIVAFASLGVGLAGIVPGIFRAAATNQEVPSAIALAAVTTAGYTGFLVGAPAIGTTASVLGLPRALGLIVVALAAMSLLAGHARVTPRSTSPTD